MNLDGCHSKTNEPVVGHCDSNELIGKYFSLFRHLELNEVSRDNLSTVKGQKMSIEAIVGSMFSFKTSELFRRIRRARIAGAETVIYKYADDVRFGDDKASLASSHDGVHLEAVPVRTLDPSWIKDGSVIGIDEGQFMGNLVEFCVQAAKRGCKVIVAALSGDYKQEMFPNIIDLLPKCDRIDQLTAICTNCGADAPFTKRLCSVTEQVLIGGKDVYAASCRKCL
jgi:thymidine kinase